MKKKAPRKTITTINPEYVEWQKIHGKAQLLNAIHVRSAMAMGHKRNGGFAAYNAAIAEGMMYFPEDHGVELPEDGHWLLIVNPPHTEIKVARMSIFYGLPEVRPQNNGFALHLAKILTPDGSLWLWPHEYRKIDVAKYLEFIDNGYTLRFLGNHDALPLDKLFYVMSRGLAKNKAIQLLLPALTAPDVCWLEPTKEISEYFGG